MEDEEYSKNKKIEGVKKKDVGSVGDCYGDRRKKFFKSVRMCNRRLVVTAIGTMMIAPLCVFPAQAAQTSTSEGSNTSRTTEDTIAALSAPVLSQENLVSGFSGASVEKIPYNTREIEDPSLSEGVVVTVQEGVDGTKINYTGFDKIRDNDGNVSEVPVHYSEVVSAPVEKVVRKGTGAGTIDGISDKTRKLESERKAAEARAESARKASTSGSAFPVSPPSFTVSGSKTDWMTAVGIPESDWGYVDYIISRESGWRPNATNRSSGAYGLPQSLPGSKMASAGADWQTNPVTQLRWANSYALGRYGSWAAAYQFWVTHHWW